MKTVLMAFIATVISTQAFASASGKCSTAAAIAVRNIIQTNFPGKESKSLEIRKVEVLAATQDAETLAVTYGYASGEMRGDSFDTQVTMTPNWEHPGRCVLKAYEAKF